LGLKTVFFRVFVTLSSDIGFGKKAQKVPKKPPFLTLLPGLQDVYNHYEHDDFME
jgi:hypothetical protein